MQTFAPSDIEVEPEFELIAEWRNYSKTRKIRAQDAILTSMYDWMIIKNYTLRGNLLSFFKTNAGYLLSRLGLFNDKVPANMSRGFLKNLILLEMVSEKLESYLFAQEEDYFKTNGHSLDYTAMLASLENYRQQDCRKYIEKAQKPDFHRNFRPENINCQEH